MNHFLAVMFCIVIAATAGIVNLMYGWGLQVKSWPVIMGMMVFGFFWTLMTSAVSSSLQKAMSKWLEKREDKE